MNRKVIKKKYNVVDIAEAFKSIAHPERIRVLKLLYTCGCSKLTVKSIYHSLRLEQSVVSRHLGILKRSGLLKKEIEGRSTYYLLNAVNPICICIQRLFIA